MCQSEINVCVLQPNQPALCFSSYSGGNDFLGYLFRWLNGLAVVKVHLGHNLFNDIELDYGFYRGGFLVIYSIFIAVINTVAIVVEAISGS